MPLFKMSLREYMDAYRADHTQLGTRLTHIVGIPMIVASIPTVLVSPPAAIGMFGVGWALQFVGHYVFEKKDPAFFSDPVFLLIGVLWVIYEIAEMLGIHLPLPEAPAPAAA